LSGRERRRVAAFLLLCLLGRGASAAGPEADPTPPDASATTDALPDNHNTAFDAGQEAVSKSINEAAQWIDSFFDDDRYIAEDASTRLRISQGVFAEEGEALEFKTRANISIDVPRFRNRLRLFVSDDSDEPATSVRQTLNSLSNDSDEAQVGLQYFAKATRKTNLSMTAGIKLDSVSAFVGPRLRRTFDVYDWLLRFTQRVRWYTDIGWEATTRFDFERLLSRRLFLRNTLDGRWREEDEGYRYEIGPSLSQWISPTQAVEYQWINQFRTRPNHRLEESGISVRYRQRILRKWLFYEIAPQVAFRNDDDFDPTPGINLRLEVVFGGKDYLDKDGGDETQNAGED
jgi:hypothetical protein